MRAGSSTLRDGHSEKVCHAAVREPAAALAALDAQRECYCMEGLSMQAILVLQRMCTADMRLTVRHCGDLCRSGWHGRCRSGQQ